MAKPSYKVRIWKKGGSGRKTMHGHMGPYANRKDAEQDAKAYKTNSKHKVSTEIIKITPLKNPGSNAFPDVRPNPRWVGPNWHLRHTPKVKKGLRNLVDRLRFEYGFDYADTRAYFDHSTRDVADGSRNMSAAEFDEFMATLDETPLDRFQNPVGDIHQVMNHAPRENPHQGDLFGGAPQQDIFARSPVSDEVVQVYRIKEKGPFTTSRDTFADEISADAARRRVEAETFENENRDLMIRFTGKKRDVLDLLAPLTYSARLVRAPRKNTAYRDQYQEAAQETLFILKQDVMSNEEVDRLHNNEHVYRSFVEREPGEFYEGDPNLALREISDAIRKAMLDIGAQGYIWFVPDDLLIVDRETADGMAEQGQDIYELDRGDLVEAVTGDRETAYRYNPGESV